MRVTTVHGEVQGEVIQSELRSPVGVFCHSLELPFVFDTLGAPGTDRFTGPGAPQALADEISGTWVRFARHGTPGGHWAAYAPESRWTSVFDVPSRTEQDPRSALRLLRDPS